MSAASCNIKHLDPFKNEVKRQQVHDFLDAGVAPKWITDKVGMSLSTIYNLWKAKKAGKSVKTIPRSGAKKMKRTDEFLAILRDWIKGDLTISMRQHARELSISLDTIQKAIKDCTKARPSQQKLLDSTTQCQFDCSKKLLTFMKDSKNVSTIKIFSNKKIFTVDKLHNHRNNRLITACHEVVQGISHTKHPAAIMVLGVICSDGKRTHLF